ncbi:MAG: SAM-dependent methyltransferase [Planctomycetota bacterium]
MTTPIRNVSDTALWVAMYRAQESERADAIFRDPFARRLAGERGPAILRSMRGMAMDWPMIVRTAVMDEIVLRLVAQGCRTVLNLACGLDTRPWRLELPRALRWIDADLPGMIEYKRTNLAGETPRCAYEAHAVDLADAAARRPLFADAAANGPVLVVAEGLLIYLRDPTVQALARDLHAAGMRWWLFDLVSPPLLKMLQKRYDAHLAAADARMGFAPAAGTAFFAPEWRELEFRSTWEESLRLKRTVRMAWLWRLMAGLASAEKKAKMRRFAGIVLLERV